MTWDFDPVPAELVDPLRAALPDIVDEIVEAVQAASPVYRPVLAGPEGIALRLGIEQAVRGLLDAVQSGERPAADTAELWRRLGEVEYQSGRDLEGLREAFRIGARAAWRSAAAQARANDTPAAVVIVLAEELFMFTDDLAAGVSEGYLLAQSDQSGERERRRRRLVELLLDPAGSDQDVVLRAARLAAWPLPRRLAVVAYPGQLGPGVTRHLGGDVLVGSDLEGWFMVVPDPDGPGRRESLDRAVGAGAAAVGPTVSVDQASRSLAWARRLLALMHDGLIPESFRRVEQHLVDLLLSADAALGTAVIDSRLGPLLALRPEESDRLLATLSAWLAHQRHTPSVAAALNVHPQTVRYRVARLHELLGEALDDPSGRFELELALWLNASAHGTR